jgi:hypothetical protein
MHDISGVTKQSVYKVLVMFTHKTLPGLPMFSSRERKLSGVDVACHPEVGLAV